jgi:ankyrin repeat protein
VNDALNDLDRTPLHYAVIRGNLPIVKMLVDNGANYYMKDG